MRQPPASPNEFAGGFALHKTISLFAILSPKPEASSNFPARSTPESEEITLIGI